MIAVAPMGDAPAEALAPLHSVLGEVFGARIVMAPALPLPPGAYDAYRQQHLSTALLDTLARARRPGWDRLLGVAVFSLWRLRADAEGGGGPTYDRRAATEAIHELGHAYGLTHCQRPRCVMWFSNSLAETDRKGPQSCRAHSAELRRRREAP